jgi:uncharacterized protein (TIGR03083 family)
MTATRPDLRPLATAERRDLADLLGTLSDDQWDEQSLCEGWTVRQVAAHIISYDALPARRLLQLAPRSGFRVNRMNARVLAEYDDLAPAELVAVLRRHLRPRGLTTAFRGAVALTDCLIHHQDIRRPLGLIRDVPAERLRPVLDFALMAPPLPSRKQVRGLRLVATDVDWTHGDGPEIRGPGEALLMLIAGRTAALTDLDGPGLPLLSGRRTRR